MFQLFRKNRMWRERPLKDRYRVVIIGLLDKGYLGGGARARTTAIIRSNLAGVALTGPVMQG